jgi:DNA polymerase-3 subunit gamma/tau
VNKKLSLANKYRPKTFEDVSEQDSIKTILENQIKNNNLKHAYLFCGGAGTGKCLPLNSDIMTLTGYKKMKDIQLGDSLIDGLGKECKVIGIYPQGIQPVYKVTFSDRTSTLCSLDHIWRVGWYSNKQATVKWDDLTLKEIMKRGLKKKNNTSGWKFRIPIPKINCWNNSVPIDPYLLGVLLGDGDLGSSSNIKVSLYEKDIFNKIKIILNNLGYDLHLCDNNKSEIKDYSIVCSTETKGFINYINNLDIRCRSIEKHIPQEYLFTTFENRIKLLQGLFDTDGYIDSHNNFIFTTSSPKLSEDFAFLVRSLGGTDTIVEKPSGYKHNGYYIQCHNHFNHYIKFDNDFEFCTSIKHKKRIKNKQNAPLRRIINIEYVGEEECQCIAVDSLDSTYMTNDLIVTHNTTSARIIANLINNGQGRPIEIDCASNNGVDAMRNIQEECRTRPLQGKYKIFILDECHMITTAGWNSMLKILEEPPEYVIFIFCTTDPQKIIGTIMSRVQRFNFKRISTQGIVKRLKYIIEKENIDYFNDPNVSEEEYNARQIAEAQGAVYIDYEESAIQYIARLAKGGMRDAITTLEKCIDFSPVLTIENVQKVTSGGVDEETLLKLCGLILFKDSKKALIMFNDLYLTGIDTSLFVKLYMEFLQNCIKYLITEDSNIVTISDNTIEFLKNNQCLDNLRNQFLNLLHIRNNYSSEDLKILVESWIVEECI